MPRFTTVLFVAMVLIALCLPEVEAQRRARRASRRGRGRGGRLARNYGSRNLVVNPKKDNFGLPYRVTQVAYLNVSVDGKEIGQIRVGLFGETVPRTAENFRALCTGEKGFGYAGSSFHRLVRGFILQGGDFTNGDGTGGYSIYKGGRFEDENFIIPNGVRTVAMANAGRNNNGAQFFISLNARNGFLNGKHVVFGIVLGGFRGVVKQIERKAKTNRTTNRISNDVRISAAGVMAEYEVFAGKLRGEHIANEDGTEGPKKPLWRPHNRRARRGGRRSRRAVSRRSRRARGSRRRRATRRVGRRYAGRRGRRSANRRRGRRATRRARRRY